MRAMMKKYIISLDQGTTSSRAIIFDRDQNIIGMAQKEFAQHYPRTGWVEHDPMEIYASQYGVMTEALFKSGIAVGDIAAIGITNQRETTIVWEKDTGRPICNAIVWQCRRTAALCEEIKKTPLADYIRKNTGLVIDAYFSATKLQWILDKIPGARVRAQNGELLFGTVDTWLVWKLTGGRSFVTDYTNASRTMLYNIRTLSWDTHILDSLGIPSCMLPEVRSSSEIYGTVNISGSEIPVAGIAGDQQAALFGQTCFSPGDAKNTYGTGCFFLMNTGSQICESNNGLLSTIAVGIGKDVQYAVEGSVFTGGSAIQWLRDELRILSDAKDAAYFAGKVPDNGGVYMVPAFTGLGTPYWDMYARGMLIGITRGTKREHIIRAAEEAIAYQSKAVLNAVVADTGIKPQELRVDGGASGDDFLMQFQADIMGIPVRRPMIRETTALGAAYLAGLAVGLWRDRAEICQNWTLDRLYTPQMSEAEASRIFKGWNRAVERAKAWAAEDQP